MRFCGGCFVFSLHGKKRKHKTPQQLTCVASSRNFLPCPLLRKVKKSKQLVREQTKPKTKTEHSRCRRLFSTPNWPFPPSLLECMHGLTNRTSNVGSVCAGGFREESSLMTGVFCFYLWFSCFSISSVIYVFSFSQPPATRGWALRAHFFYFRNLASYKCFRLVGERRVLGKP